MIEVEEVGILKRLKISVFLSIFDRSLNDVLGKIFETKHTRISMGLGVAFMLIWNGDEFVMHLQENKFVGSSHSVS